MAGPLMADDRVRDGYPQIIDNLGETEGDEGNEGVPPEYLDGVLKGDK